MRAFVNVCMFVARTIEYSNRSNVSEMFTSLRKRRRRTNQITGIELNHKTRVFYKIFIIAIFSNSYAESFALKSFC